jgi:hypothetical protein
VVAYRNVLNRFHPNAAARTAMLRRNLPYASHTRRIDIFVSRCVVCFSLLNLKIRPNTHSVHFLFFMRCDISCATSPRMSQDSVSSPLITFGFHIVFSDELGCEILCLGFRILLTKNFEETWTEILLGTSSLWSILVLYLLEADLLCPELCI